MASGPPEHHMDRLGRRLGDRSCNPVLAPEEWVGSYKLTPWQIVSLGAPVAWLSSYWPRTELRRLTPAISPEFD
jgi:hypothetical protein